MEGWKRYYERMALVEMKFNRLLVYPGIPFHGHWQEPGAFRDTWRLNQLFFFADAQLHPPYHQISAGNPLL